MPDITMCSNDDCPMSLRCYRHEAEPNMRWQSYSAFSPAEDGKCNHFWAIDHSQMQRAAARRQRVQESSTPTPDAKNGNQASPASCGEI